LKKNFEFFKFQNKIATPIFFSMSSTYIDQMMTPGRKRGKLDIIGWQLFDQWKAIDTSRLAFYCFEHNVDCLVLSSSMDNVCLFTCGTAPVPVFPQFRMKVLIIHLLGNIMPSNFAIFFQHVLVETIVFWIPYDGYQAIKTRVIAAMCHVSNEKWLQDNHSVKNIIFKTTRSEKDRFPEHCPFLILDVNQIMEQNRASYWRCKDAVFIFLSRKIPMPNKARAIIAKILWRTRGTFLWKPSP
jgi:hypothetical protein